MLATAKAPMHPRSRVTDLRGRRTSRASAPILADPSGRRARRLRVAGRVVALLFLAWLSGLVLAGVGLLPIANIPLGASLETAVRPARLDVAHAKPAPALLGPRTLQPVNGATGSAARGRVLPGAGGGRRSAHTAQTPA